jgi:hypothetical protein
LQGQCSIVVDAQLPVSASWPNALHLKVLRSSMLRKPARFVTAEFIELFRQIVTHPVEAGSILEIIWLVESLLYISPKIDHVPAAREGKISVAPDLCFSGESFQIDA